MSSRIKTTAQGGGVYIVMVNGVELTRHSSLHKAVEAATNAELANPVDEVWIEQGLRIKVEQDDPAPTPEPAPEPTPEPTPIPTPSPSGLLAQEVARDTDLASHPDVLWYPRFDSWAHMKEDWSTWPGSYGDDTARWPKCFFVTAPEFGIPAARFESQSASMPPEQRWSGPENIMQMQKYFNSNYKDMWTGTALGSVPLNDLYMRYCIMLESDVWAGINETGMKLPGFQGRAGYISGTWMHHSTPGDVSYSPPYSLSQPIHLQTYFHGGDIQKGETYGKDWLSPGPNGYIYIEPNKWNCIEHHLIMNSKQPDGTGNHDGLLEVWWNDELILSFRNVKLRDYNPATEPVQIQGFHGLIYHGGQQHVPIVPIHYRITGVVVAKKRIGMPRMA